ncbi:MAG: DUF456 family protein [Anaerolineae bacterium]|nr:DUF456 family protein [Anaerolineae bacterium]
MEDVSIIVAAIFMIVGMFLAFIPFVPGPALVWCIGFAYAIITDFDRVTVLAVIVMTLFMIVGASSDLWLRALGMKARGTSCWGTMGSFAGGILGTFFIPIPILGTMIGLIAGALLVEFMRLGELKPAWTAGRSALEIYVLGKLVEFSMSAAIVAVFAVSAWQTA